MKQLAIICQGEDDIESRLSYCVKGLANAGVGALSRGYAVWTEDHQIDRAVPALRDAGLTSRRRTAALRKGTPAPATSVSNQDSHDLAALRKFKELFTEAATYYFAKIWGK